MAPHAANVVHVVTPLPLKAYGTAGTLCGSPKQATRCLTVTLAIGNTIVQGLGGGSVKTYPERILMYLDVQYSARFLSGYAYPDVS